MSQHDIGLIGLAVNTGLPGTAFFAVMLLGGSSVAIQILLRFRRYGMNDRFERVCGLTACLWLTTAFYFTFLDGSSDFALTNFAVPGSLMLALHQRLLQGLQAIDQVFINGHLERRVPHNLNASFNYVEGESLIMGVKGLAVSSGSACTSASLEPSYVLRALGRSDELAHSSLRMTIGRFTTELFSGFHIKSHGAFRVLRDSDVEMQEEAEDLVRTFESLLKRRRRGNVIRLELEADMPRRLQKFVIDELEVGENSVFVKEGLLGLSDTQQIIGTDRPDLLFHLLVPAAKWWDDIVFT